MTQDPNAKPDGTNEGMSNDDTGSGVDKALYDELEGRVKRFDDRASEMGFSNSEEYLEWLEEEAYRKIESGGGGSGTSQESGNTTQKNEGKPAVTEPAKQQGVQTPVDDERFQEMGKSTAYAVLESQYAVYKLDNSAKPVEERSNYSKDDLSKIIQGPKGSLVHSLSKSFGGNLWKSAEYLLDVEGGLSNARSQGAKAQQALTNAQGSGIQSGVGIQAPAQSKSSEQEDPAKQLADLIAPKAGGYSGD